MSARPNPRPSMLPVLVCALVLAIPLVLMIKTIATEYRSLADIRFQLDKSFAQGAIAEANTVRIETELENIQSSFTSYSGDRSRAVGEFQSLMRAKISQSGGVVNAMAPMNSANGNRDNRLSSEAEYLPLAISIRWTGDEDALWAMMDRLSKDTNHKLDTYAIRPMRNGLGELDIRMQVSALWLEDKT